MSKMDGMEEGGSGLTEGGQTDPLGPKSPLGSPASQTSHLPPFPLPLSLLHLLTSTAVRKMVRCDRKGLIRSRFPSKSGS